MLGIALGVAVLITVLSVMNGFDYQIKHHIFDMARQVTVNDATGRVKNWPQLEQKILKTPNVVGAAPFVDGQGMLTHNGVVNAVIIHGVDPQLEMRVSRIANKLIKGSMSALKTGKFGMVIGDKLASMLGLQLGDHVTLVTPQVAVTPVGMVPRFKRFKVVGVFHVGGDFGFDRGVALIDLKDAQVIYKMGDTVSGLRIKVNNLYAAPRVSTALMNSLPERYSVSNWTELYGAFFKAIRMEKTMMFIILLLIVAVAAFNLVATLVMVVSDKRSEIAILRTLGARPRSIMATFMVQGCVVGLIGTLLGVIGGVALAMNATTLVGDIERLFSVQLISSSVYFVDFLPSRLEWGDVWHVCLLATGMSLIATLYPAWRAARTQPAEALRYE